MPRVTLQEQWDALRQELKLRVFYSASAIFGGTIPINLWGVTHKNEVEELTVEGPGYLFPSNTFYHRGRRPTRVEVSKLRELVESNPQLVKNKLLLYWRTLDGGTSAAYFLDPEKSNCGVYLNREEAEIEADRRRVKTEEENRILSEGHIRCRYCGDIRKPEDIAYARMWNPVYRGGQSDPLPYCKDKGCAGYDQMGHEG